MTWFEVFVDEGEEGTHTIEDFTTLQAAKEWISVQEDMDTGCYYIDEWKDEGNESVRILREHYWLGVR
jgi:hypothetical protein